jgi:hypothetical protein
MGTLNTSLTSTEYGLLRSRESQIQNLDMVGSSPHGTQVRDYSVRSPSRSMRSTARLPWLYPILVSAVGGMNNSPHRLIKRQCRSLISGRDHESTMTFVPIDIQPYVPLSGEILIFHSRLCRLPRLLHTTDARVRSKVHDALRSCLATARLCRSCPWTRMSDRPQFLWGIRSRGRLPSS